MFFPWLNVFFTDLNQRKKTRLKSINFQLSSFVCCCCWIFSKDSITKLWKILKHTERKAVPKKKKFHFGSGRNSQHTHKQRGVSSSSSSKSGDLIIIIIIFFWAISILGTLDKIFLQKKTWKNTKFFNVFKLKRNSKSPNILCYLSISIFSVVVVVVHKD